MSDDRPADPQIDFDCYITGGIDRMDVRRDLDEEDEAARWGFRLYRGANLGGSVYLTDDDARRLFNWLGAQLLKV